MGRLVEASNFCTSSAPPKAHSLPCLPPFHPSTLPVLLPAPHCAALAHVPASATGWVIAGFALEAFTVPIVSGTPVQQLFNIRVRGVGTAALHLALACTATNTAWQQGPGTPRVPYALQRQQGPGTSRSHVL